MKLMLGFSWAEALEYAGARGWSLSLRRRVLTDEAGDTVIVVKGDDRALAYSDIMGHEFNEIIRGHALVSDEILEFAHSFLRPPVIN